MNQNKKLALIITNQLIDELYIANGNTTIIQSEQEDLILELMGLQHNGISQVNNDIDDDEVKEVKLITNAGDFKLISYGVKAILITTNAQQYKEFNINVTDSYKQELLNQYDLILVNQLEYHQIIEDIKQFQYNILFLVNNIVQEVEEKQNYRILQSRYQYKYQELQGIKQKQLALIHISNYAMRVDEIKKWEEINNIQHYIRNNSQRLQCVWREILSYLGRFPKYGA